MGVVYQRQRLSDYSSEISLRNDFKYINSLSKEDKSFYTFKKIFDFVEYTSTNLEELEEFLYSEIGDVSKNGDVNPVLLSFNDRNEENESLFKKIEKGDIIKPLKGDILISKIRPYLNKNVLIGDEEIYYTKAFIHIRPKINSEIFYFAIRTIFYNQLIAVSRQGKGYPTLKEDDLKTIRFSKHIIDSFINNEDVILSKTNLLNTEITNLKNSKLKPLDIINKVFGEEFGFDWLELEKLSREKVYKIKFSKINDTIDFRTATKFHSIKYDFLKLEVFKKHKFKDFAEFMTLGRQIQPEQFEEETDYYYLMPNAIKTNSLNDDLMKEIKFSFFDNLKHIALKYNDLILAASGEGTIGKSAIFNSEKEAITSQFIMKIELKDKSLVEYFHYYMQSSFFLLTVEKFKKGMGNMTNIFVSQVKDFPVLFDETKQAEIVKKIKSQIDAQNSIDHQIEQKQQQINELIENAIKTA
jgi:type I restriction enzyme S subunit